MLHEEAYDSVVDKLGEAIGVVLTLEGQTIFDPSVIGAELWVEPPHLCFEGYQRVTIGT